MYPFCVFFIVKVKVLAGSIVLSAVSKGLNAPGLTFDPVVCEKSKSKVRPKKKFARAAGMGPGRVAGRHVVHASRRRVIIICAACNDIMISGMIFAHAHRGNTFPLLHVTCSLIVRSVVTLKT